MKKQLKILTAFAFLALPNLCGTEQEFDIETGLNGKSNSLPIVHEEQKLNEQPSVLLGNSDDVEVDIEAVVKTDVIPQVAQNNLRQSLRDLFQLSNFFSLIQKNIGKLIITTVGGIITYKICQH